MPWWKEVFDGVPSITCCVPPRHLLSPLITEWVLAKVRLFWVQTPSSLHCSRFPHELQLHSPRHHHRSITQYVWMVFCACVHLNIRLDWIWRRVNWSAPQGEMVAQKAYFPKLKITATVLYYRLHTAWLVHKLITVRVDDICHWHHVDTNLG